MLWIQLLLGDLKMFFFWLIESVNSHMNFLELLIMIGSRTDSNPKQNV